MASTSRNRPVRCESATMGGSGIRGTLLRRSGHETSHIRAGRAASHRKLALWVASLELLQNILQPPLVLAAGCLGEVRVDACALLEGEGKSHGLWMRTTCSRGTTGVAGSCRARPCRDTRTRQRERAQRTPLRGAVKCSDERRARPDACSEEYARRLGDHAHLPGCFPCEKAACAASGPATPGAFRHP